MNVLAYIVNSALSFEETGSFFKYDVQDITVKLLCCFYRSYQGSKFIFILLRQNIGHIVVICAVSVVFLVGFKGFFTDFNFCFAF